MSKLSTLNANISASFKDKPYVLNMAQDDNGNEITTWSLFIFGDIDAYWGVNSAQIFRELRGKELDLIKVYMSTPGGSAKEAFEIHDFLAGNGARLEINLFGECCSAGTIISSSAFKSGDVVRASKQLVYMTHKAIFRAGGNADELREAASILDVYDNVIVDIFTRKTGMTEEKVRDLLKKDAYMNAQDAMDLGFVDEVVDFIDVDFSFDNTSDSETSHSGSYWDYFYKLDSGEHYISNSARRRAQVLNLKPYNGLSNQGSQNQNGATEKSNKLSDMNEITALFNKALAAAGLKIVNKEGKDVSTSALESAISNSKDSLIGAISAEKIDEVVNSKLKSFEEGIIKNLAENEDFQKSLAGSFGTLLVENLSEAKKAAEEIVSDKVGDFKELKEETEKTLNSIRKEVAEIKNKKSGDKTGSNGGSIFNKNKEGDSTEFESSLDSSCLYALNLVRKGAMTPEAFKSATGKEIPEGVL